MSRQRKFALAQAYIERFWKISDTCDVSLSLDRRYLILCEDEFDIARVGWVEGGTWTFWHQGIQGEFSRAGYQPGQVLVRLNTQYPNQFRHLKVCLGNQTHDAFGCPGLRGAGGKRPNEERLPIRLRLAWWIDTHLLP